MGSEKDPPKGAEVAKSCFAAVVVYAVRPQPHGPSPLLQSLLPQMLTHESLGSLQVFLVFCGFQALLHFRQSKRGAISLN